MYEKWLKAFHTVAAQGGVSKAAKALNVGQPTISAHLKTLEDYFKVELFYRRGKRLELTDVGRSLHEITRGLYGHESEAVAFLRSVGRNEHGRLRLGSASPYDVIALAHGFHARHRFVEISVETMAPRDLAARLRAFELDVGIFADEPEGADFASVLYDRHPVRVIAPAGHRLARRKSVRLEELDGEAFVTRMAGSVTQKAFDQAMARAGVRTRSVLSTNSREAGREAVARGMGLAVVSEKEHAPHPEIRALAIEDAEVWTYAYVACLAARRTRPVVDAFMKLASQTRPSG